MTQISSLPLTTAQWADNMTASGPDVVSRTKGTSQNEGTLLPPQALLPDGAKAGVELPLPDEAEKTTQSQALSSLGGLSDSQVNADIYAFMALFQKLAQTMRDNARLDRSAQMQSQVTALKDAAGQMRESAALRFAGGIVSGALQVAGGAAQMGMSAASAAQTIKGAQIDAKASNLQSEMNQSNLGANLKADLTKQVSAMKTESATATAAGAKLHGYGMAMGSMTGGLGGVVSSAFELAAGESDAQKAELDAKAKVAETGVQHANDLMQQMMDVIRDVRDKLQSIQQAGIETNRGIARNI